jgi:hypothetical protein
VFVLSGVVAVIEHISGETYIAFDTPAARVVLTPEEYAELAAEVARKLPTLAKAEAWTATNEVKRVPRLETTAIGKSQLVWDEEHRPVRVLSVQAEACREALRLAILERGRKVGKGAAA